MSTAVVWFRKCLRLHDNPALSHACSDPSIDSLLPVFILDPSAMGPSFENLGSARLSFLIESLDDLDNRLKSKYGGKLFLAQAGPLAVFENLHRAHRPGIGLVSSDYCSEPSGRDESVAIQKFFGKHSPKTDVRFHPSTHTLCDLEQTIASPVYDNPKSMRQMESLASSIFGLDHSGFLQLPEPLPEPRGMPPHPEGIGIDSHRSSSFSFHSVRALKQELSSKGFLTPTVFTIPFVGGETEALARMENKVSSEPAFVNAFRKPRTSSTNSPNDPIEPSTTGLSPYLSTGCLSVRRIWKEVEKCNRQGTHSKPPESLHGQLLFREMFYLLSRSVENWDQDDGNPMCKPIAWGDRDEEKLLAWEEGRTGFPYIDAMMRQLETTGWMHHLGRHAVSCFLTRGQLWQHWKHGRDVFGRKLLDSDWALNNANWLWLAGVAPFSMPYFRLYNPCPDRESSLNVETSTAKFIKFWVPELKNMPTRFIYEPHLAPVSVQKEAQCLVGRDYPNPIVDRKKSAKENLTRFKLSLTA